MTKAEMTPRERILAAVHHEPTDRVPTDYWGVEEITQKLMVRCGVAHTMDLYDTMGIDKIIGVGAPLLSGQEDVWHITWRRVPLPGGMGWYDEPAAHPLADCDTIDSIEAHYTWPTTELFNYSAVRAQCKMIRQRGYAVEAGYISLTYIYELIRGTEQMLLDFAADPALAEHILMRINGFASEHARRLLEAADGLADFTQVTDDLGGQHGLILSPKMIDRYLGRYYEANIAAANAYGAVVFHHDDGAITPALDWIVEKGCRVLNPLQWHLPGWDLHALKRDYGQKLCFHGGIDNQHVLPFGSTEDVKAEVRACMDALYADRTGFILAPCHNAQAITPVENLMTLYAYAREYSAVTR
jgi:uroporphyrinogen decarboxylase